AVEPAPDTYALLLQNLDLNAATGVTCCAFAIGAEEGVAMLNLASRGAVMNSTAVSGRNTPAVTVPMVSLEGLFERENIAHCDYLKMDCEGGEYAILLTASDATLQRIERICMEYHETGLPHSHHDLRTRLERAGFRVVSQPNRADPGQGWLYAQRAEKEGAKPRSERNTIG
ncbi:MAG: FkbM family methyltransferase, partial [Uliginosibacterium sp.]|nr:FkbM family methyltransferase [Uliginosibacterium sp.]